MGAFASEKNPETSEKGYSLRETDFRLKISREKEQENESKTVTNRIDEGRLLNCDNNKTTSSNVQFPSDSSSQKRMFRSRCASRESFPKSDEICSNSSSKHPPKLRGKNSTVANSGTEKNMMFPKAKKRSRGIMTGEVRTSNQPSEQSSLPSVRASRSSLSNASGPSLRNRTFRTSAKEHASSGTRGELSIIETVNSSDSTGRYPVRTLCNDESPLISKSSLKVTKQFLRRRNSNNNQVLDFSETNSCYFALTNEKDISSSGARSSSNDHASSFSKGVLFNSYNKSRSSIVVSNNCHHHSQSPDVYEFADDNDSLDPLPLRMTNKRSPSPLTNGHHSPSPTPPNTSRTPVLPPHCHVKLKLRMKRSPILDEVIEDGCHLPNAFEPEYEILALEGASHGDFVETSSQSVSTKRKKRRKKRKKDSTMDRICGVTSSSTAAPRIKTVRLIVGGESRTINIASSDLLSE